MSPEQAQGPSSIAQRHLVVRRRAVGNSPDRRAAFPARVVTRGLAGMLRPGPNWNGLPAARLRACAQLLRRCLPQDLETPGCTISPTRPRARRCAAEGPVAHAAGPSTRRRDVALVLVALMTSLPSPRSPDHPSDASRTRKLRLPITTPPSTAPSACGGARRRSIAYVATLDDVRRLLVHSLTTPP